MRFLISPLFLQVCVKKSYVPPRGIYILQLLQCLKSGIKFASLTMTSSRMVLFAMARMFSNLRAGFVVGALLLSCASAANAAVYNATSDFSLASNPNGVWAYLGEGSPLNVPVPSPCITGGLECWYNGSPVPDANIVAKNISGGTLSYETIVQPTSYLEMDPESGFVTVSFTTPTSGYYNINGDFLGIDTGENAHTVTVSYIPELLPDPTLFTGTIDAYGADKAFNISDMFLNAGDIIDFTVDTGTLGCSYCNLSTGLQATISTVNPVPEPVTLSIFGAGLAGAAAIRRRRKSKKA